MQAATDSEIFARAAREERALISADADFASLLALRYETSPSLILLRRGPKKPADQLKLILANLPTIKDPILEGSVVVIQPERIRARRLPIAGAD
jgi:predicted nuclease of predicted toxin-antitoxin system